MGESIVEISYFFVIIEVAHVKENGPVRGTRRFFVITYIVLQLICLSTPF